MTHALVILDLGLTMGLIFAPTALSMMLSFRCLDFPDLTVEASLPLGGAVCALTLAGGWPSASAFLLGAGAAAVAGSLTALIHDRLGLSKLLAGVIVLTMFYSIILRLMGGSNISLLGRETVFDAVAAAEEAGWFGELGGRLHAGRTALLSAIVLALAAFLLLALRTKPGLRLQAVGSNPLFAQDMGVATSAYIVGGLAAANALAGLSGALLAVHQGFADVNMGQGTLVVAIASLAIGEKLFRPVRSWPRIRLLLVAAVTGSVIYQAVIVLALRLGLAASDLKLATAVLVLMVMAWQYARPREVAAGRGY